MLIIVLSTGKLPFKIIYGHLHSHFLDVSIIFHTSSSRHTDADELLERIKTIQWETLERLKETTSMYKKATDRHKRQYTFQAGDWVMVFFRRQRFPLSAYYKLGIRKFGPSKGLGSKWLFD